MVECLLHNGVLATAWESDSNDGHFPISRSFHFLTGGGEAGALIRAYDWSATSPGEPAVWQQPLQTLVGVMLAANQPMFIAWGPERILLYNDAYAEILASQTSRRHGLRLP